MSDKKVLKTTFKFDDNKGICNFPGHPDIAVGNPTMVAANPEFWTPPAMLLAATESCFYLTTLALSEKMRIGIKSYSSEAEGVLDNPDGQHTQFTEITIRPKIELEDESKRNKLSGLFEKAEEYCYVARSLNCKIKIET